MTLAAFLCHETHKVAGSLEVGGVNYFLSLSTRLQQSCSLQDLQVSCQGRRLYLESSGDNTRRPTLFTLLDQKFKNGEAGFVG